MTLSGLTRHFGSTRPALAFPHGSMTAFGLPRKEARGRACHLGRGKDYTIRHQANAQTPECWPLYGGRRRARTAAGLSSMTRSTTLSTVRPIPRRGLSRDEAAMYIGISASKFDELVRDRRMPAPKRIDGRLQGG